jgi:hypothetical protein
MNRIAIVGLMALLVSCASSPPENSVQAVNLVIARSADIAVCDKAGNMRFIERAFVRDQMVCDRRLIPSGFDIAYGSRCYPITDFQWFAASLETPRKSCQAIS